MSDPSPTRVLRRTLEESLDTHVASTVLFEALGVAGTGVPRTREEVLDVVRGPLRAVLGRRLAKEQVDVLVSRVETQLAPVITEPETLEVSLEEFAEASARDDATTAFPTASRAVPVLVASGGPGFGTKLELALGESRVAPRTVSKADALAQAMGDDDPPALFIVDAIDPPPIDERTLLRTAAALPTTTACVLFGAELPWGKRIAAAIQKQERSWVTLERREGVAPLLDLVRSRRKSDR